jgi:hypothetical protein
VQPAFTAAAAGGCFVGAPSELTLVDPRF